MIRIEETPKGELLFVQGEDREEVQDEEVVSLLRALERAQVQADSLHKEYVAAHPDHATAPPNGDVGPFVTKTLVRLLKGVVATIALRQQELEETIDALAERGAEAPTLDGYVLVPLEEVKMGLAVLQPALQILFRMAQQHPRTTPEEQQMAALYEKLAADFAMFTNALNFRAEAVRLADEGDDEDEDEDEEGDDEDDAPAPPARSAKRSG